MTDRRDSGQIYAICRVLPGTYAVHGDPDRLITFHSNWDEARAALVDALSKEKRVPTKLDHASGAASMSSLTFTGNVMRRWASETENRHIAEKYVETHCMSIAVLAYANGLAISFASKFYFLANAEELPKILDEFNDYRELPTLTPKGEDRTGKMTREEIDRLFEQYGLNAPGPSEAAAAEDVSAL